MERMRIERQAPGDHGHLNHLGPNLQRMMEMQIGIAEVQSNNLSCVGPDFLNVEMQQHWGSRQRVVRVPQFAEALSDTMLVGFPLDS